MHQKEPGILVIGSGTSRPLADRGSPAVILLQGTHCPCKRERSSYTETFFPEDLDADGHLTPRPDGEPAAASKAARLLLIHFHPGVMAGHLPAEVRAADRGQLVIGRNFLVVPA